MQPLISIALCTYNGSRYLEEQLMSIVNQTYKNIEVIVVDDCSTDNTFEITNRLARTYPQIKAYRNDQNLGFNKNFEKAIELTTGQYIAISDQDDIWMLDKLALLFSHIGTKWLIFSNSVFIDDRGNDLGKTLLHPSFELGKRDFRSLLFYNFVTGHTILFERSFISYILPVPNLGYYDWWMGFIALYHNQIVYLNQNLTLHRTHASSVMHQEEQANEGNRKRARFLEITNNLEILNGYKNLKPEDKQLIANLLHGYKRMKTFNSFLVLQMIKNYPEFFPDLKNRNLISRFNFALKLSHK